MPPARLDMVWSALTNNLCGNSPWETTGEKNGPHRFRLFGRHLYIRYLESGAGGHDVQAIQAAV
jgi:hypothetical protein